MKIAKPIRDAFDNGEALYIRLKREVREVLKPRVEDCGWFYRDRVKSLESFALKVETGRYPDYARLEDFFACTVIVPTFSHLPEAVTLVSGAFEIVERRPKVDAETRKSASDFVFDELRLYVKRLPATDLPPSEFDGIVFEIQIKTILQYAWGIATHDLIYKTDEVSWPKERIPKHLSDRLPWLSGSELVSAWLWMISPGRYRLLSDEQVKADPHLEPLHQFMLEKQLIPSPDPRVAAGVEEASVVARLQPTQLKLNKSYWRLSFPAVLDEFVPSGCDKKKFSILLSLDGYLEIWYTEILRTAVFQHSAT